MVLILGIVLANNEDEEEEGSSTTIVFVVIGFMAGIFLTVMSCRFAIVSAVGLERGIRPKETKPKKGKKATQKHIASARAGQPKFRL